MGNMRKADVQTHSEYWRDPHPAINVKHHIWWPDIVRKFKDTTATSKNICQRCGSSGKAGRGHHYPPAEPHGFKGGGTYGVHEYGNSTEHDNFWRWIESLADTNEVWEYPNGKFYWAEEIARETGWEDAKELAAEIWGSNAVKIYSEGRSGGWLVVFGLGDIEDWDAVELSRWSRFCRGVQDILDDLDYQFLWHLHCNVYEPEWEGAWV